MGFDDDNTLYIAKVCKNLWGREQEEKMKPLTIKLI